MYNSQISEPNKLRDFIKGIRNCKTASEERSLVQKEKALIRDSFSNNEENFKARNVAKLLFINMLGHDTDFGQMECLKLITNNSFMEKRIGYLGLTQLFHEKSEVLMMATNRIHHDLNSQSNYIISLALIALSEICTADMCRELTQDILKILTSGTSFVKKKAALASTKILKKIPETADDFAQKINILMEDRHHGVLLSTLGLVEDILLIDGKFKQKFQKFFTPMIKVLKGLVSTSSTEFDINGIADPFLQMQILKYFGLIAEGNQSLSDEVSDILAQVATNTTSAKNTGNAVLYECVRTIFGIQSSSTLKTLAINILGKFLVLKDNNSKYLSLFMLKHVINFDINAVQKHKQIIMDCLKEKDKSIKQLAIDLTYMISNEQNVKDIVKELLNYLDSVEESNDFQEELCLKICAIIDKYAPNRKWYIDTVIKILTKAGNFVKEESISNLIHLISSTPQLQSYAVHELYYSLIENLSQDALAKATLYCIGEFGQLLINGRNDQLTNKISEIDIVDLIKRNFDRPNVHFTIKEYGLTSLIKLYSKFQTQKENIFSLIKSQETSSYQEVQKRACEYLKLIENQWDNEREQICDQIPEYTLVCETFKDKPIGEISQDENQLQEFGKRQQQILLTNISQKKQNEQKINSNQQNIIDLDLILENSSENNSVNKNNDLNLLQDVFNQNQSQKQVKVDDLLSDFDFNNNNSNQNQNKLNQQTNSFQIYADNNLIIIFECIQVNFKISLTLLKQNDITQIKAIFNSKSNFEINNLVMHVAVIKHLKLTINPLSTQNLQPNSQNQVNQTFIIQNTLQGQKGVAIKLKIIYSINGQEISAEVTPPKELFNFANNISYQQQQTSPQIFIQDQNQKQDNIQQNNVQNKQQQNTVILHPYNDQHLSISFNCENLGDITDIIAFFNNKQENLITGLTFQIAVQKHLKLTINPVSSEQILPFSQNQTQQKFKIQNTLIGSKQIAIKMKIQYSINGNSIEQLATFQDFPKNW